MKTTTMKIIALMIFLSGCNDGESLPRAQFHQKSADATALTEKEYFDQKVSYQEQDRDFYFESVIDFYLQPEATGNGSDMVALNFAGSDLAGTAINAELQKVCSVKLGKKRSSLSEDSQKIIIESLNDSSLGIEFVNANTLTAISKKTLVIHIGGNSVTSGCAGDLYAGLTAVDYGDVFAQGSAVVFDPPSESPEVLTKLVSHITNAYYASVGKTDMIPDFEGFTGTLDKHNIDFATTQTLEGISRGVSGLKETDIADFAPLSSQIESLVTARALPLANLNKALTVVALAATIEGNQNANKFDVEKAVQTLSTVANSPAADAVSTIAMAAGHPEVTLALEVIKAILGDGTGSQTGPDTQLQTALPELDAIFKIQYVAESAADHAAFVTFYREFNQYLDQRYSGEALTALKSLTLIAFAQAYKSH